MKASRAWALLAIWVGAAPAAAELFRCERADGSVHFADRPGACPDGDARPHALRRGIQSAPAAPATARPAAVPASEALWLSEAEAGVGWSVVREAPDPLSDPDLKRWGVRSKRARHYTRDVDGAVQVCSIELWHFRDDSHAQAAHAGFAYPDWSILRQGSLLVMLRGLTTERGATPRRGLFPDCEDLGARIRARAGRH